MLSRELTVQNELGLHARPAAQMAKIASTASHAIWLEKNGQRVDAASILDILSLACEQGSQIIVHIENAEDLDVLEKLARLIEKGATE